MPSNETRFALSQEKTKQTESKERQTLSKERQADKAWERKQITTKKQKQKKVDRIIRKIETSRLSNRKIMKKGKMSVHVPEYQAPSVLGDENRFFTGELNQEKKRLFFS